MYIYKKNVFKFEKRKDGITLDKEQPRDELILFNNSD